MQMKFSQKHLLQIHIAVLLFGGAGLFAKFIPLTPMFITFARVFFAVISLIIILLIQKKPYQAKSSSTHLKLLIPGALLAFHWFCFFKSISLSTVAIGLLTYSTFPVFVILFEPLFFREKLHLSSLFFSIVALAGIFLIVPEFDLHNNITLGVFYGVLSGVSFAFLSIYNRKLVQEYSAIEIAFFQNLGAFICLLPMAVISFPVITGKDLLLLALLGIVFTGLAHSLFISGMHKIKARTAGIIATLEPVYGIILAFILLHEIPTLRVISGGVLILVVVVVISYSTYSKSD
jgi:drug/metabolite transporter (DMT)-like permease